MKTNGRKPGPPKKEDFPARRPYGLSQICPANPDDVEPKVIEGAADTLLNGGIAALATDTIYGVAADATNPRAVERLYQLKRREPRHPIPMLIGGMDMLRHVTPVRDDMLLATLNIFWPGPLTAILPKHPKSFSALSGDATLGVRFPDHPVILGVIRALKRPLAVTSANLSGREPAADAKKIRELFGDKIDIILDSGPSAESVPSTVLDLTGKPYRVLRAGAISIERLRETLIDVEIVES